jgi:hypothetical protein
VFNRVPEGIRISASPRERKKETTMKKILKEKIEKAVKRAFNIAMDDLRDDIAQEVLDQIINVPNMSEEEVDEAVNEIGIQVTKITTAK